MCKILSKRITTLLLVLILCITLNICAFAASDSDDIRFDGYVCQMEWGLNNRVNYKNENYGNNISFANIYVLSDVKKGVLCIGFNIAEKNDYNSNSGVEIFINSTKRIKISSNNYCKNYSDLHVESKTRKNMANSYNLEMKIWYDSLNDGTTLSISFLDCNNTISNKFYIDRKNMTSDISNVPINTTKKSSSTQKHTTKKKSTTTKSKHKNSSSNNKKNNNDKGEEKDNHKDTKNGDTNYVYQQTTKEEPRGKKSSGDSKIKAPKCYSPNNNDGAHVKSGPNDNNDIVQEILPRNKTEGNFKVKKVIITTVASAMIITAVTLPVIKNNKDKKQDNKEQDTKKE